jgi:outer membrane protein
MYSKFFFSFFFLFFTGVLFSQNQDTTIWNLERCINFAKENNLNIKQQTLSSEIRKNILTQSQYSRLPSINAGANYNYNMGRTVDKYTNTFTENNVQSTNFFLSADMNLFNGFQTENSIRRNNYEFMAALADCDKLKNDISLNIASAYLQILFNIELLKSASERLNTTQTEVGRIQKMVDAGKLSENNLADIQAQQANEELSLLNSQNQLKNSYLVLKQLLDLSPETFFKIEIPIVASPENAIIPFTIEELYETSQQLPQIKAAEYRVKSYEKSLLISKGSILPRLSLTGSYGTGYSDARKNYLVGTPLPTQIGYVETTNQPVYTLQSTYTETMYPFNNQLNDNAAKSIGLQLTIPIFNKHQAASDISNSRKNVEISNYALMIEKNNLYKEIQSSFSDAESALSKYKSSQKSMEANQKAFDLTSQKFELGMLNTTDYNTSKNNLAFAESTFLQAKYEFIFRLAILKFYSGQAISIQ